MTYIISDIHGNYDKFHKLLYKIKFSDADTLYINGDIIDRGPNPIKLLLEVMQSQNMIFILGNHEEMMLESAIDASCYATWYCNGSTPTEKEFYSLSFDKQFTILDFLKKCPIAIPNIVISGKQFYLSHAMHLPYYINETIYRNDVSKKLLWETLWSRQYKRPDYKQLAITYHDLYSSYHNTTFICGHNTTPSCSYGITDSHGGGRISKNMSGHLINTDCGCYKTGVLGCLRLDDMQEFYVQ